MAKVSSFEGSPEKMMEKIILDVKHNGRTFRVRHEDDINAGHSLQERKILIKEDSIIVCYNPNKFVREITDGREVNFKIYPDPDTQPLMNVGCQEFPLEKLNRYYKEVCDILVEEISSTGETVMYIKKNNTPDSSYVKNSVYAENDEAFIVKYSDGRLRSFLKSEYSIFKKVSESQFKYTPGNNRVLLQKNGIIKLDFGGYNRASYEPENPLYQKVMNSYINGVKYFMDLMTAVEAIKKGLYETK